MFRKKQDLAETLGFKSFHKALPEDCTSAELLKTIQDLNNDENCDGILLQLPLPSHLVSSTRSMLNAISPQKDVDGFHPTNVGRLASWRENTLAPCTPRGVIHMLKHESAGLSASGLPRASLKGLHVAVIGESNVVGRPLALMLLAEGATVTVIHKDTVNPSKLAQQADVLVSCAGVAHLITKNWIKKGAVVIDVGINFAKDEKTSKFKMCGDCAPDVWEQASAVSPVPGGVGPMTVAMLMRNCVDAAMMRVTWVDLYHTSLEKSGGEVDSTVADGASAMESASLHMEEQCIDAGGNDGEVSLEEFRDALRKGIMGIEKKNWSEAEIRKKYAEADLNGDGIVSAEEAVHMITSLRARQRADWLDKNKDGEVTLDELKQAFAGSDFSDVQLLEMLLAADTNGNGKVSLDEIKVMLESALLRVAGTARSSYYIQE